MNADEKTCPRCAETVKSAALVCRYCGHEFDNSPRASPPASQWRPPKSNVAGNPSATKGPNALGRAVGIGCLGLLGLAFIGAIVGGDTTPTNTSNSGDALVEADNALAAVSPAIDDAATPVEEETSSWSVSSQKDELRGRSIHYANVTSTNAVSFDFPYGGGSTLTMTVRRHPKWGDDVIFRISKGQFVCGIDDCRGTINYGGGPVGISLVEPEDHSSDTLFAASSGGVISRLKKAERVIVELPFYQEGNRQFTFNTKGLVWPPKT